MIDGAAGAELEPHSISRVNNQDPKSDSKDKPSQGLPRFEEWKAKKMTELPSIAESAPLENPIYAIQTFIEENPNIDSTDKLDLPDEQIQNLHPAHYYDYLVLLNITNHPELAAKHIDIISRRLKTDIERLGNLNQPIQDRILAQELGQMTGTLIWQLAGENFPPGTVPPKVIENIYSYLDSDVALLRSQTMDMLDNVAVIDNQNEDKSVQLYDRLKKDCIEKLVHPLDEKDIHVADGLLDVFWGWGDLSPLLSSAFMSVDSPDNMKRVIAEFANRMSMEKVRKEVREYVTAHQKDNPQSRAQFDMMEKAFGITPEGKKSHVNISEQYEGFGDMSDYIAYNELQDFEMDLIKKQSDHKVRSLDIGSGQGRSVRELSQQGKNVVGMDVSSDELKHAHGLNVVAGSWHQFPFADESFDFLYCLGRSQLHNTTIPDEMKFLHEVSRITQKGGVFITDLPHPDKGQYADARARYAEGAEKNGIYYYESGSLHDSANGKDYIDRFDPLLDQYKAMALLANFDAEILTDRYYIDQENKRSQNIYWKLTKRTSPPSFKELENALAQMTTSGPLLRVEYV